jgi:UDP-glucose 4-epimerase
MKILVTGAAGFIGSRLSEALLGHGHDVVGIDDLSTGRADNFPGDLLIGDIRSPSRFPLAHWDVIYHCAASYKDRSDWERDASVNVLGTINVVREAQRTGAKLVYFQTSLCYGATEGLVGIDHELAPHGSYAVSKTAGEAFIRDSGVPYVSLRLANIYGPRNLSGPVPTFYQRLTQDKPCTVVQTRRDFVFVDDLVWVAVKAATQGTGVYHVSSGSDVSIYMLYKAISAELAIDSDPEIIDRGPDDVGTLLLDPSRTEVEFGWKATTPLQEGIPKGIAWYRDHPVTETYTHLALK